MPTLRETIIAVSAKARKYRQRTRQPDPRPLGETNTRATLIDPLLDALGWDTRDADEVAREYRPKGADNPVDYALKLDGNVCLLIEAKGLGEAIDERRWVGQMLGYATVAGVEWCVLTDGEEYRFYNAMARVDADRKLFCRVHLTEDSIDKAARDLTLLSRASLTKSHIEDRWLSFFVDRRVEETMQMMLGRCDKALVRLIQQQSPKPTLTPKEISTALRRLDFRPRPVVAGESENPQAVPPPSRARGPARRNRSARRDTATVSLVSLIHAGILKAPMQLFRRHKGHDLTATLAVNGSVTFKGKTYDTCSAAGEAAREFVSGRKMNTNGWIFWQFRGTGSKPRTLNDARAEYATTMSGPR